MWEDQKGEKVKYKERTFNVFGKYIIEHLNQLRVDPNTGKLVIPNQIEECSSPVRKQSKLKTPSKSVHCELQLHLRDDVINVEEICNDLEETILYSDSDDDAMDVLDDALPLDVDCSELLEEEDNVKKAVKELQELLPSVTAHLDKSGRLHDWVHFFHLVDRREFNMNHIAVQLFLDVVKFSGLDNIREMRYTPEVKRFWTVGQSLFKGKFLRFMGGFKTYSNVLEHGITPDKSTVKADMSMVNFVCPHKDVLREEKLKCSIDCASPGIIQSNIKSVAAQHNGQNKSYNLCVDGKKIAAGFGKHLGDVDLFGHESDTTLAAKKERLEIETCSIDQTKYYLSGWIERDITDLSEVTTSNKELLHKSLLDILSINTERLKELRNIQVRRQISLEKLIKLAAEPWQTSKYSFAISSIKTHMYDIRKCVKDMLELNKSLGLVAAACKNAQDLFSLDDIVELSYQENYVCLNPSNAQRKQSEAVSTEFIKQRTNVWHNDRQLAKVTGSTLFDAVGLSTLKRQQAHYDRVNGVATSNLLETPNEVNEAMKHGIENEINALGTIVSRVLPVFAPFLKFHEEGYYKMDYNENESFLIVSPDGSCREQNSVKYAIEIKCPVPGKIYKTDVHYEMPRYYVTQILAEMAALNCEQLLYVSWSPESTTVSIAKFDEKLWKNIMSELHAVYGEVNGASRPKAKRPIVRELEIAIKNYVKENITLLFEIPSVTSVECSHPMAEKEEHLTFQHYQWNLQNVKKHNTSKQKQAILTIESLLTVITKEKYTIMEAYNILRTPAKEVLVAVLSDLDRQYGPNSIHGIPIAYGLAGYSMSVKSMRLLMENVVVECYKNDICIKSLSTDGQFYRLCVRDKYDRPLTLLQLAKDTWETVKKVSKAEQIRQLTDLNAVKYTDCNEICSALVSNLSERNHGPIIVSGWKEMPWPTLYNPRRLTELLNYKVKRNQTREIDTQLPDLENMPVEAALSILDQAEDELKEISSENILEPNGKDADLLHVYNLIQFLKIQQNMRPRTLSR